MQLKKIYDALDHAKTGMLSGLPPNLLLHIVPMWTANKGQTYKIPNSDELCLYGKVFGSRAASFVNYNVRFPAPNRKKYFKSVTEAVKNEKNAIIFLDADTGVAPKTATKRHVRAQEIEVILGTDVSRIVIVYQHGNRTDGTIARVTNILATVCPFGSSLHGFAFWGGTASLMFFGYAPASHIQPSANLIQIHTAYDAWAGTSPNVQQRVTKIYPVSQSSLVPFVPTTLCSRRLLIRARPCRPAPAPRRPCP